MNGYQFYFFPLEYFQAPASCCPPSHLNEVDQITKELQDPHQRSPGSRSLIWKAESSYYPVCCFFHKILKIRPTEWQYYFNFVLQSISYLGFKTLALCPFILWPWCYLQSTVFKIQRDLRASFVPWAPTTCTQDSHLTTFAGSMSYVNQSSRRSQAYHFLWLLGSLFFNTNGHLWLMSSLPFHP